MLTASACCRNSVTHLLKQYLLTVQQSCIYGHLYCDLPKARHLAEEVGGINKKVRKSLYILGIC